MQASQILDFLFQGRYVDSIQAREDPSQGFTHILNVKESAKYYDGDSIQTLHVPLSDYGESDLEKAFKQCFPFIAKAKSDGGKILVHCRSGQNRSTAVVVGYLMLCEGLSLRESWELVSSQRPSVGIAEPYWRQLEVMELKSTGKSTFSYDEIARMVQEALKES